MWMIFASRSGRASSMLLLAFTTLNPLQVLAQRALAAFPSPLDAARDIKPLAHTPLPEQYIWTAGDATFLRADRSKYPWRNQQVRIEPHRFRKTFHIDSVPRVATLYLAGPRDANVFLNGKALAHLSYDIDAPIGIHVFHVDATGLLRRGDNVIAIQAVRGRGIVAGDPNRETMQLTYGEVLAVKLVAAASNREGPALLLSDKTWRSAVANSRESAGSAWTLPAFDDSSWPLVDSLGGIESDRNFMQWSADAGMYAWPGYEGISPPLGTYRLRPAAVGHVFSGASKLTHIDALTTPSSSDTFTIDTSPGTTVRTDSDTPALLLDFGREIAGRVLVESLSGDDAVLSVAYGESELEALATGLTPGQRGGNYLGTNLLEVPVHAAARGPKSAFRYVRVRFLRSGPHSSFRIQAEGIAYPVTYTGTFQSSDPLLDRIWETGAYTAHLCMQDDLWDAPKRDRGRWAGDIDVEGRVISSVFGDKALLEQTLSALGSGEGNRPVNGIPGYSALWITSLASLYAHSGDLEFLRAQHQSLLRVIGSMNATVGPNHLFVPAKGPWPFIDWAPGLYGPSPGAIFGTNFQYLRAYRAAALLLKTLGDSDASAHVDQTADQMQRALADSVPPADSSQMGKFPQLYALAVQSGVAQSPESRQAIWSQGLSHVKQDSPDDPLISPYFNATVIDAMSLLGHQREALDWIRTYWGGMLDEGATSFWESYDLRWPKTDPHLSLQADGTSGFFVSLAHGWSSGPTAWLSENVLGIRDPMDGYRTVTIAPRLLGLSWAKGSVPTPQGAIHIAISYDGSNERIELELPAGVEQANISLAPIKPGSQIDVDGKPTSGKERFPLSGIGRHAIRFTPAAH